MSARLETSGQGEWLSKRFGLTNPPTMSSLIAPGRPATYARLLVGSKGHHLGDVPAESAYSLQIVRNNAIAFRLRESRGSWQQKTAAADSICLFNLEAPSQIAFDSPFETIRCFVPRAALLDLAADDRGSVDASLNIPPMGTADPFIALLGRTLGRLFDEDDNVNHLLIDHLTLSLHCHLLDAYGWGRRRKTRGSPKLFAMLQRRAKEALDAQILNAPSIAEMAQECGLSSLVFTRAFRHATGRLPHQWAMDRRMDLARSRLLHSDDNIATIAATCGFSQPGNFSRAFISAAGVGPAAWRRAKRMPNRWRSISVEVRILGDRTYANTRKTRTGDITLKLLPRETGAANSSRDGGNTPRNECPQVLLSRGEKQVCEAPDSLRRPTVIVYVDPQVLASLPPAVHFLAAPQRADEDGLAQELVAGLIDCCRNESSCETRTTGYWAIALCAHLARLHGGLRAPTSIVPKRSGQGLARWQLREALDAVNARLDSRLLLSCLAAKCGLSVGHFATAFARSTGLPPHRWITQQRVARAMQLLRERSRSFAEIALTCGFSDQSHFSRVFSATTGLSPRRWQRSWDLGKRSIGPVSAESSAI